MTPAMLHNEKKVSIWEAFWEWGLTDMQCRDAVGAYIPHTGPATWKEWFQSSELYVEYKYQVKVKQYQVKESFIILPIFL